MLDTKKAFTMLELVFVIVVLGILAAVAIPKLSATRVDAQIAKARSDVSAIRSAIISERQTRLITGDSSWINSLSHSTTTLFDGNGTGASDVKLLMYGIKAGTTDGHWSTSDTAFPYIHYTYKVNGTNCYFSYSSSTGVFDLNSTSRAVSICTQLVD